ncbi:DUF6169 family protein [Chitinophaga sp. 22620]|uniref:DUF6169 family protein n=1 Tax=Chitinophaga sp. 22620 TaxID=3453952 RepID=UPI003F84370D
MKNDSLFENDPVVGQYIYALNINVMSGKTTRSGFDPRIADTVFEIITDFLDVKRKAFVYICDSSDSRELARKRKFDLWFAKYSKDLFAKCEYEMVFGEEKIHSAMIVPLDNKIWPNYMVVYHQLTRKMEGSKEGEKEGAETS